MASSKTAIATPTDNRKWQYNHPNRNNLYAIWRNNRWRWR